MRTGIERQATHFYFWGLVMVMVFVAGCSYDSEQLGTVACDNSSDCGDDAVCENGYCVFTGEPETDAGHDVDLDVEPEPDVEPQPDVEPDVEPEPDVDVGPEPDVDVGPDCPGEQIECNDECVDPMTDPNHCDGCDNPCPAPESHGDAVCVDGQCDIECDTDYDLCGQECVDLQTDGDHCGECDDPCGENFMCSEGACVDDCPGDEQVCNGGCFDLDESPQHCGECGDPCEAPNDADPVCDAGTCEFECHQDFRACEEQCVPVDSSMMACDDQCVDTDTNSDHCGDCGEPCEGATPACADGICCAEEETNCDDQCVDTETDPNHCGECGDPCDDNPEHSSPTCEDSQCDFECDESYDRCDEQCVDYQSDPANCGGCGVDCEEELTDIPANSSRVCNDEECDFECDTGFQRCDGECIADTEVCTDCDPGHEGPFGGGEGEKGEPYLICTIDHLDEIADGGTDYLDDEFLVTEDLELEGEFDPIGSDSDPFQGFFDGGGHTISGLEIDLDDEDVVGMFRRVDTGGVIQNVELNTVDVKGDVDVGALVGINDGTIQNAEVDGGSVLGADSVGGLVGRNNHIIQFSDSFVADAQGERDVGGLVGTNAEGAVIEDSSAHAEVDGDGEGAGGLVGFNDGTIERSYATGNVGDGDKVGGLVGFSEHNGQIATSTASGAVTGSDELGGLIGHNKGLVDDSYATGDADGEDRVGGLVGFHEREGGGDPAEITNCYAIGDVSGDNHLGALVGERDNQTAGVGAGITASYYDDSSGHDGVGTGGDDGGVQGLLTDDFDDPASFPEWDFDEEGDEIWEIGDVDGTDRPVLQWQNQ